MKDKDLTYLNVRTMKISEGFRPSDIKSVATKQDSTVSIQGYTMSQETDFSIPLPSSMTTENVILQTRNYAAFKFDLLNRAIRQDKLDRLYDAIQAKNLLHLFPIVVSQDFVVIDGQHRLKVAEALNVPIYYIISSQMRIQDAALVNSNVSLWRGADYLAHWRNAGLSDYLQFSEFWKENQFLPFSTTLKLLSYGAGRDGKRSLNDIFVNGEFKIGDISFARKVALMARDFSRWVKFWKDTVFVSALINLAANPEYVHERMMQKMEYLSVRLVKCADIKGYLYVIEEIYNYKVLNGNRPHFKVATRKKFDK